MKHINMHKFLYTAVLFSSFLKADNATNFSRPFDALWDTENWVSKNDVVRPIKLGVQWEGGSTRHSFSPDAKRAGLFEQYQPTQSAIAMLLGSPSDSQEANLLTELNAPIDDGVRGNFDVTGTYHELDTTLFGRINFHFKSVPGYFDVTAYVPIKDIGIEDISWKDLTTSDSPEDILVKDELTSKIDSICHDIGDLSLAPWKGHGLGDVALQLRWHKSFAQLRRYLKYVRLTARGAITVPTGAIKDEDSAFSLPMGNDGAFGLPLGGSLDLWFLYGLRFGLDVDYMKLFDTTRERRLKTDMTQTELLLLHKGVVRKKYGNYWKFNLHTGAQHFVRGLSAMVEYEYKMHNDDKFFSQSNSFDNEIINSAESLRGWTTHSIIVQAAYDFFIDLRNFPIKPQLMFFAKFPVAGRRSIEPLTLGGQITLNF